ncbi:uncharacterized protein METZ01_LOCUS246628, partial [marine metagenome]
MYSQISYRSVMGGCLCAGVETNTVKL